MVELCSDPNTEFSPGWQNTKTFGNFPDIPSLKVEFIDSVNGLGRKRGFDTLTSILIVWWVNAGIGKIVLIIHILNNLGFI